MLKKVKHKLLELLAYHWDKYFDKERYSNLRIIDAALRNIDKGTSTRKWGLESIGKSSANSIFQGGLNECIRRAKKHSYRK